MLRALPRTAFALAVLSTSFIVSRAQATASAELYSQAGYRYGRFRARVQFPAGDGIVGSFFLWKDGSEMAGVFGNELDFEKIGPDCSMQTNAIFGLPPAMNPIAVPGVSSLCAAYHTYTYEWTPDHIAWLIDDSEVRREVGATAGAYADNAPLGMQLRFNVWPGTPALGGTFSTSELPAREFVSYVEYAAYTPGTGDDGGDFSFTWRESFEQGMPAGWAVGNWNSNFNLSTHSPLNVTFVAGVAVLSLTDDGALGFSGVPPVDDGDLPSQRGPLDAGPRDGRAPADAIADRFDAGTTDGNDGSARGLDAAPDAALAVDGAATADDGSRNGLDSSASFDVDVADAGVPLPDAPPEAANATSTADSADASTDTSDAPAPGDEFAISADGSVEPADSSIDAPVFEPRGQRRRHRKRRRCVERWHRRFSDRFGGRRRSAAGPRRRVEWMRLPNGSALADRLWRIRRGFGKPGVRGSRSTFRRSATPATTQRLQVVATVVY